MKITFLGHQSWLLSSNDTHLLVDPVLDDSFGYNTIHGLEIFPPRSINIEAMPKVSGIILSHEHSDHFHIPTLLKFKGVPIYTSHLMSTCVTQTLRDYKLNHVPVHFNEMIPTHDIEFILYPSGASTVFWESRVSQVYARDKDHHSSPIFIAVDALISDEFKYELEQGSIIAPKTILLSNNSQVTPKGVLGSLDNLKTDLVKNKGLMGLKILHELLVSYMDQVDDIDNFVICGGGFMKKYDTFFGTFPFSEQDKLANAAQLLVPDKVIIGPLPGETITLESDAVNKESVDWVSLDTKRISELEAAKTHFDQRKNIMVDISPVLPTFTDSESFLCAKDDIEEELNELAKAIMLSKFGQHLINHASTDYSDIRKPLRFCLLHSGDFGHELNYYLDINSSTFILSSDNKNILNTPFGIECFLSDFYGIIRGEIQVWDIAGTALRSWYEGDILNGPVGFFYSWYGELLNPARNYECYKKRWRTVISEAIGELS